MSDTEKVVSITKFVGSQPGSGGVTTYTTSSTNQIVLDSWSESLFRSAKYEIQIESINNTHHVLEMRLLQNGLGVWMVQYGEIYTSGSLGVFDADISNAFVNLLFTPVNASTVIKFTKVLIPI
jgi:hypothetical protein